QDSCCVASRQCPIPNSQLPKRSNSWELEAGNWKLTESQTLRNAFTLRHPPKNPRGQVNAANYEGHEDGGCVEAAPRAGADPAGAAVRHADAARAEQPGHAGGSVDAPAARRADQAAGRRTHAVDRYHR